MLSQFNFRFHKNFIKNTSPKMLYSNSSKPGHSNKKFLEHKLYFSLKSISFNFLIHKNRMKNTLLEVKIKIQTEVKKLKIHLVVKMVFWL